jgi:hypothetical protein
VEFQWPPLLQNGDAVECMGEWARLICSFYSSGGWESDGPERLACGGGANLMLQF